MKMPASWRARGTLVAAVLLLTAVFLLAATTSTGVSLGVLLEPTIPGAGHKYGASCQNCLNTRCTKPWNGCDKHMGYEDASAEQHHACMCGCCALQCNLYRGCEASPTAYSSAARFNKQLLSTSSANTVWETFKENGRWMIRKDGQPFTIKGACYSPTEIAGDINFVDVASGTTMWGDYFWDSLPPPNTLWNWFALWGTGELNPPYYARDDFSMMSELGMNSVRTYFMQSRLYTNDSYGQTLPYTHCSPRDHTQFLNYAEKAGLSVIVGIALPANMIKQDLYDIWKQQRPSNLQWWLDVIVETATQVGSHPAVMGFTIMNELDDPPNAFPYKMVQGPSGPQPQIEPATDQTNFWYARAIQYADMIRKAAPGKLVGWAIHDAPVFVKFASATKPLNNANMDKLLNPSLTYMEQLSAVFDYFGVNTYQTESLETVVGATSMVGDQLSYGDPSIAAQIKPVILTEIGWSAAGRSGSQMIDTPTTQANVAAVMNKVMPQCYGAYKDVCVGMFWFEFTDEWWKDGQPTVWNGGSANPGFPNGYWDDEAFGLYSRMRSGGRANASNNWHQSGPTLPVDTLVDRTPMTSAIKSIYAAA